MSDFIDYEAEVDEDEDDDEDAYADYGANDLQNEAEEAGQSAREIEAGFRKKERAGLGGFDDDQMDIESIERYYRDRWARSSSVEDVLVTDACCLTQ